MKYTKFHQTDLKVSRICLGTMTFGEQNTEEEAFEMLDYSVASGINFLDTAEMYASPARAETQGDSERLIGRWLKLRGQRDKWVIATKITGPLDYFRYIRDPLDFSPQSIRHALEESLKRLQTDYVDLYQLHWPERSTNFFGKRGYEHDPEDRWTDNFREIIQTMDVLIREGKIRHYGVSNETPWGLMHFIRLAEQTGLPRPVSIQNPYSLLNRTFETGLAEICIREGVGLMAYSPLAYGLLTGKYHDGSDVSHARMTLYPKLNRYHKEAAFHAAERYIDIAKKFGLSAAQMALAFINSRAFLLSNIIGATTLRQMEENIASIDLELEEGVIEAIDAVHDEMPDPAP
jgi:aryl-alcohol dehydrogenase-like predicted oxidoreductase